MLFLSLADVQRLLDLDRLLAGLEDGFKELSAGRASVPPLIAARTPAGRENPVHEAGHGRKHRDAFKPYPAGAHELQGMDARRGVELGEILSGAHPGRTGAHQLTVYKSTGHAVEDAVAAAMVYEAALAQGAGLTIDL